MKLFLFRSAAGNIAARTGTVTNVQPVPPKLYTESDLTNNDVYKLAKKSPVFSQVGLEMVLRALSKTNGSGIVKNHDKNLGLDTYTHTTSGHSITLNIHAEIVDYSPKS